MSSKQSDKESANAPASQHEDLQPQQAPVPHHHPPLAAGLRESPGGTEKSDLSFSEPASSEQQSPNSPVPALKRHSSRGGRCLQQQGHASGQAQTAASPREHPGGRTGPRAGPGSTGTRLPTPAGAGCPATKGPPAPASCGDAPGWLLRGATTTLPAPSTELLDTAGEPQALRTSQLSLQPERLLSSPLPAAPGALARCGRAGQAEQRTVGAPFPRAARSCQQSELPHCLPGHYTDTAGHSPAQLPDSASGGRARLPFQPANTLHQLQKRPSALGTLGTHLRRCQTRWRQLQRQRRRAGPRWFALTGCSSAASAPPSPIPAGRYLPEEHPWSPQTPWEEHTESRV